MKKQIFTAALILTNIVSIAQDSKSFFIGFQPAMTKEKFYAENEFDLNVFPLVLETKMIEKMNIRTTFIANYHFGNNSQFSDIGIFAIAPFYLTKKEEELRFQYGAYLGPLFGFGRNLLNKHTTTTVGLEGGYLFKATKNFTLSIGLQLGGSYFNYDILENKWVDHFGIKVNLGWLINSKE